MPWVEGIARGTSRVRPHTPVACDPVNHPVVRAWQSLSPLPVIRVDLLRQKRKAAVYRLVLDDAATRVIAKHGCSRHLVVERTVYESVLPRLGLPALGYHGFVGDGEQSHAWLFIEDAGDVRLSSSEHDALAGRWLGALHGAAAAFDLASSLPDRGPAHYLEHLRAARTRIVASLGNPALGANDRRVLRTVVSSCHAIERRWSVVEGICHTMPRTLVHGDLSKGNLRLRWDNAQATIVAFDWEWSGWGVPAADVHLLVQDEGIGTHSYCSAMSEHGRALDAAALRLMRFVGSGFRLLDSVNWASTHLPCPQPEKGVAFLNCYEQPLLTWSTELALVTPGRGWSV